MLRDGNDVLSEAPQLSFPLSKKMSDQLGQLVRRQLTTQPLAELRQIGFAGATVGATVESNACLTLVFPAFRISPRRIVDPVVAGSRPDYLIHLTRSTK